MPEGVACTVSNCQYWHEGNACGAEKIAVEIDAHAQAAEAEFADESFLGHQDSARTSSVTCCQTFVPRS